MPQLSSPSRNSNTDVIPCSPPNSMDVSAEQESASQKLSVGVVTDAAGTVPSDENNKENDSERIDNPGSSSPGHIPTPKSMESKEKSVEAEEHESPMMVIDDDGTKDQTSNADSFPTYEPETASEKAFNMAGSSNSMADELEAASNTGLHDSTGSDADISSHEANGSDDEDDDAARISKRLLSRPNKSFGKLPKAPTYKKRRGKIAGKEPKVPPEVRRGKIAGKEPKVPPPETRRRKISGKEPKVPPEVTLANSKIESDLPDKIKGKAKGKAEGKAVTKTIPKTPKTPKLKGRGGTKSKITRHPKAFVIQQGYGPLPTYTMRYYRFSDTDDETTKNRTSLAYDHGEIMEYNRIGRHRPRKFPTHFIPMEGSVGRLSKWITFKFGPKAADSLRKFDFSEHMPPPKFDMPSPDSSNVSSDKMKKDNHPGYTISRPGQATTPVSNAVSKPKKYAKTTPVSDVVSKPKRYAITTPVSDVVSKPKRYAITTPVSNVVSKVTTLPEIQIPPEEYPDVYDQEEEPQEEQAEDYKYEVPDPMTISSTPILDEKTDVYMLESAPASPNSLLASSESEGEDVETDKPVSLSPLTSLRKALPKKGDFIPIESLHNMLALAEEIERAAAELQKERLDPLSLRFHQESQSCIVIINDMLKRRKTRAQRQREVELDEAYEERQANAPCTPEKRATRSGSKKREFEPTPGDEEREAKRHIAEQRGMRYCGRCKKERDPSEFDGLKTCMPCLNARRICDEKYRKRKH
ncbi:hypothetical protein EDC01DRAFT_153958 [Geopyxis carbonaria]|nr:hypothetical protein EDC01DRAFT_153958 [Geopyxis carbonaria]